MQEELPFKRKSEFQHIAELLPAAMDRLLDRAEKPSPPIPDDEAGQVKWFNENL